MLLWEKYNVKRENKTLSFRAKIGWDHLFLSGRHEVMAFLSRNIYVKRLHVGAFQWDRQKLNAVLIWFSLVWLQTSSLQIRLFLTLNGIFVTGITHSHWGITKRDMLCPGSNIKLLYLQSIYSVLDLEAIKENKAEDRQQCSYRITHAPAGQLSLQECKKCLILVQS